MLQRVDAALERRASGARRSGSFGIYLIDLLTPLALLDVIGAAARGNEWAIGVILQPPRDPRFAATRLIPEMRRSPWGAAVHQDRHDPAASPIHAALAPHVTLLRQRSPANWRALDARASHRTATAAAQELGCSQQTMSRHLDRSNRLATANTARVIEALLQSRDRQLR